MTYLLAIFRPRKTFCHGTARSMPAAVASAVESSGAEGRLLQTSFRRGRWCKASFCWRTFFQRTTPPVRCGVPADSGGVRRTSGGVRWKSFLAEGRRICVEPGGVHVNPCGSGRKVFRRGNSLFIDMKYRRSRRTLLNHAHTYRIDLEISNRCRCVGTGVEYD